MGVPEILREFKGDNLSAHQLKWTSHSSTYRGCVEHVIGHRLVRLRAGVELEVARQLFAARRNHEK